MKYSRTFGNLELNIQSVASEDRASEMLDHGGLIVLFQVSIFNTKLKMLKKKTQFHTQKHELHRMHLSLGIGKFLYP